MSNAEVKAYATSDHQGLPALFLALLLLIATNAAQCCFLNPKFSGMLRIAMLRCWVYGVEQGMSGLRRIFHNSKKCE